MIVKELENELTTNIIRHLARLSDCIFAFAMALTVIGFDPILLG
jgi:cob(I)alamin adenosyltransferase